MLRTLRLKSVYRSETDDLLRDFYLPALAESRTYDRAVGFFSAAMFSYAAQGLATFLHRGGRMRLIFGGEIDAAELNAMDEGYRLRAIQRIGTEMVRTIDNIGEALAVNRLEALAWMVANGQLDVKVALKPRGMYHEKIGIFTDEQGDRIVFQGSANETANALLPDFNFESINVFPTWRTELQDHFAPYVEGFERLWNNNSPRTLVVDLPDAVRERLIRITSGRLPPPPEQELLIVERLRRRALPSSIGPSVPRIVNGQPFKLREHQQKALNAWRAQDLQGILAMATGSGKTLTALYGLTKIFEVARRLFVVIAVPYQSLADQWVEELEEFGVAPIRCYAHAEQWTNSLSEAINRYASNALPFVACVVVNRTLQSAEFQNRISQVPKDSFAFIGDECHHHMAAGLSLSLPQNARFRLGLSATPEHAYDPSRTALLTNYYGQIAARYSLADALADKVLCPYTYHVHFVRLNGEEAERYVDLSRKISRLVAGRSANGVEESDDSGVRLLLFQRARLLGNAAEKIDMLRERLESAPKRPYTLFYCGDGTVEDDEGDSDSSASRQVDVVSREVSELGWRVGVFTARESSEERRYLLDQFKVADLDALVAIRCLDEGVDVPDCRTAYLLASSRSPRQFIQRRGRVLRQAPGKDSAEIHDFVVRLPEVTGESASLERNLLKGELKRVAEFATLAMNRAEVLRTLEPLLKQYDLAHFAV